MRLDKLIANCGFGSRKEAKILCKKGLVTVDGLLVTNPETHIDPEKCRICVGETLIEYEKYSYLMMNKPTGVISATFDEEQKTVVDLIDERYRWADVFPVGRLDKDTTGLLILSNDGGFAHRALSPKKKISKVYIANLSQPVETRHIKAFESGITLDDGYKTMPAGLIALDNPDVTNGFEAEVTIREGKFHQVKRMFEALGIKVSALKRVTFAGISLDESLKPGEYRRLNEDELAIINNLLSKD